MYRCSLCWKDDKTLLIGWGDKIKVCLIREREQIELRDLPDKYVEISKSVDAHTDRQKHMCK